jgi:hypothetical protein
LLIRIDDARQALAVLLTQSAPADHAPIALGPTVC